MIIPMHAHTTQPHARDDLAKREAAQRDRAAQRRAQYDGYIRQALERHPDESPEHQQERAAEYERELELSEHAEALAACLLDVAGQLGWGCGEPLLDAINWLHRIAVLRGLVDPTQPYRPPTRREQADRAIQKAFRRIGERDGFSCRHCGVDRTLTVDHVMAVVNGGSDEDDNLQLLCRACNSRKGAR